MLIDLEGVVGRGPLEIDDKLQECEYFLDLMGCTTDWTKFRWLTSAFLNASRAALDWLAWSVNNAWIDEDGDFHPNPKGVKVLSQYAKLSKKKKTGKIYANPIHPVLKKLAQYRSITSHVGPLSIKPERVSRASEFVFREGDDSVLAFGKQVSDLLAKMQREINTGQ